MHSSCSHGLSNFLAFLHIHSGNHFHEVDFYALHFHGLLLLFLDSTLFGLFLSLESSFLLFLSLFLISDFFLLSELGFHLIKALLVLLPSLDLWNLIDTNSLGVWLEEVILIMLEDMIAGFFGKSDSAVSVRFTSFQVWKRPLVV